MHASRIVEAPYVLCSQWCPLGFSLSRNKWNRRRNFGIWFPFCVLVVQVSCVAVVAARLISQYCNVFTCIVYGGVWGFSKYGLKWSDCARYFLASSANHADDLSHFQAIAVHS